MKRPYIFCHMMSALDGRIMGNYMDTEEGIAANKYFYEIAFGENPHYRHQGWLSGRVSTDDNFTFYEKPDVDESKMSVEDGDFIAEKSNMYYVSIDPKGKLAFKENYIKYKTTVAKVIEVLTEEASNPYKNFLRRKNISYIIAGKEELDYELALEKLKNLFGIETLMLGGGGVLNWSFIQRGLCDELSIVMSASADGNSNSPELFTMVEGLSDDKPVSFELMDVEKGEKSSLWIRYKVKNNVSE